MSYTLVIVILSMLVGLHHGKMATRMKGRYMAALLVGISLSMIALDFKTPEIFGEGVLRMIYIVLNYTALGFATGYFMEKSDPRNRRGGWF